MLIEEDNMKKNSYPKIHEVLGLEKKEFNTLMSIFAKMSDVNRDSLLAIAALSSEDRQMIIDYWGKLWGPDYARSASEDLVPQGKRKEIKALIDSGIQQISSLSNESKDAVKNMWANLLGSDYADDMVKNYQQKNVKTIKTQAGMTPKLAKKLMSLDDDQLLKEAQRLNLFND